MKVFLAFIAVQTTGRQSHGFSEVYDGFLHSAHVPQRHPLQEQRLHTVAVQLDGFSAQIQGARVTLAVETVTSVENRRAFSCFWIWRRFRHIRTRSNSPRYDPGLSMLVRYVEEPSSENLHVFQMTLPGHQIAVYIHTCKTAWSFHSNQQESYSTGSTLLKDRLMPCTFD